MSWEFDLARFLTACAAGILLSFAGSIVQLTGRNELASPSTLGMDGAAVFIIMLAYLLESFGWGIGSLSDTAFLLGLVLSALLWFTIQKMQWRTQGDFRVILLLGLSVNLFVGSLFAVMQFLAMAFNQEFPEQLWFGRMQTLTPWGWGLSLFVWVPLVFFVIRHRRSWKALLLGTGWCHGLGIPVDKIVRGSLLLAFVATLWVVTQFGVFSFLGLLGPLLLRQLPRYRGGPWREMTDGALLIGLFFALLDHGCFNLTFHGAEIPVGLPSALFGAAALVGLLWIRARKLLE
jgi:iron complex transport system permease protein